jgi:cell division protein FtsI/penicillin-binding protein 2
MATALRAHVMTERDTVACHGKLTVAGHNLACSHPRDVTVLDAREALANSCNTYFATMARRMSAETLAEGLRGFGVVPTHTPRDADDRVLMALGLQGTSVSPVLLAEAYRKLALAMNAPDDHAARVVEEGMVQSVQTGMAHAARVEGTALGGKTGTVDDPGGRSHGWFAGIVFDAGAKAQRVVVVFVPNGNGNDAAALAKRVVVELRGVR